MIPTVPFDLILNVGVGLALVWCARERLAVDPGLARRQLLWTIGFEGFVFVPIGAWLYLNEPGWSWNYFLDPGGLPAWAGPLAVGGYLLAALVGHVIGRILVRAGHGEVVAWLLASIWVVLGAYFVVFAERFWWVGTFQDWSSRSEMTPLPFHPLGWFLAVAGPAFVGGLLWLVWRGRKDAPIVPRGAPNA